MKLISKGRFAMDVRGNSNMVQRIQWSTANDLEDLVDVAANVGLTYEELGKLCCIMASEEPYETATKLGVEFIVKELNDDSMSKC